MSARRAWFFISTIPACLRLRRQQILELRVKGAIATDASEDAFHGDGAARSSTHAAELGGVSKTSSTGCEIDRALVLPSAKRRKIVDVLVGSSESDDEMADDEFEPQDWRAKAT